ncbi:MAG: hypothetical protein FWH48_05025 [Oscillospiraceae bacterium]|nr:hypothetical protein [Oscillospiraceae bacterium]
MNSRERVMGAIERKKIDHCPIWESFWGTTFERWYEQGLPRDTDIGNHFCLDGTNGTYVDWSFQYPARVIEETDEYTISVSAENVKSKTMKKSASMLELSEYSIVTREDWEQNKPRFVFNEARVNIAEAKKNHQNTKDSVVQLFMEPCLGFEKFKYCMGTEMLLVAIAEDPEWIKDMVEATERLAFDGLDYCLGAGIEYDIGYITEDMGFSNGPFFSPAFYKEIIFPSHKRYCDYLHSKGMKAMLHSCGDNRKLLPLIVEAGFDILNPLEAKAGMDVIQIKKDYGDKLTLWGGIDVKTISGGDMDKLHDEIKEKVSFAKQGGGYIFGSDHSIPDNVPLEAYENMVKWGLEYGKYD